MSAKINIPMSIKLGKLLGKGQFGEVYEGSFIDPRDNTSYDSVAIKVLSISGPNSAALLKSARKEVRLVQKVLKSNQDENDLPIVKVIAHIESDDTLFIIMEKCDGDGVKFAKLIRDLKLKDNFDEVLKILKKNLIHMCQGLEAVHKSCVVHRDIKPQNLLIDDNTSLLKISDFGISCFYRECKGLAGTKNFMEPICFLSTVFKYKSVMDKSTYEYAVCEINQLSDVFSLGLTFYYFLTGSTLLQSMPKTPNQYMSALKHVHEQLSNYGKRSYEWNIFTTCLKYMTELVPNDRPTPVQCIAYLETGDMERLISEKAKIEKTMYIIKTSNCKDDTTSLNIDNE
jgi:serine/threonine protein kinase